MAKRFGDKDRLALPLGREDVRRRLDGEDGEGTSNQPHAGLFAPQASGRPEEGPRGVREDSRLQGQPSGGPEDVSSTPRRNRGVLRGIRRRFRGLRAKEIDDYMLELDRREADHEARDRTWSSSDEGEDITPDEDSGDEYLPLDSTGE